MTRQVLNVLLVSFLLFLISCSSAGQQQVPEGTIAGAALGGAWGSGAGAVIGNQVATAGTGAAVGAGFGIAAGALSGAGYDFVESDLAAQRDELSALRAQNQQNEDHLRSLQISLDRAIAAGSGLSVFQVFFDIDQTNLKSGSIAQLEALADSIKTNPRAKDISLVGNADDSGAPDYNERLAEARAREVASYLMRRGISQDQIKIKSAGSAQPIVSNINQAGRQLNRRVDIYVGK